MHKRFVVVVTGVTLLLFGLIVAPAASITCPPGTVQGAPNDEGEFTACQSNDPLATPAPEPSAPPSEPVVSQPSFTG